MEGPSKAETVIRRATESRSTAISLASLELDALPEALRPLKHIQQLNVSGNLLASIPDWMGELTQLEFLNVARNKLETLPASLANLARLRRLDLTGNALKDLPESIGGLTELRWLDASRNQLTSLPQSIGRLRELHVLHLDANRLRALPDGVQQLAELQSLTLSGNELAELPDLIGQMNWLWELDLSDNHLSKLPLSMKSGLVWLERLFLHGNAELALPPEILGSTPHEARTQPGAAVAEPSAVLDYYFSSRQRTPLNEAKMLLVGRGGVGKTSLVKRLLHDRFDSNEHKTEGIAITNWDVQVGKDKVRLNIWDFGGQEIMHATHQFFLTKRSLYILVINAREGEQDANIEYWLRLIESFGGESPVIVVINKIKHHLFDLNRRGLQDKFPAIREFIQTDCEANIAIDQLRAAIIRETDRLEHVRDRFPANWFSVKDRLGDLGEDYISYERYQELCFEQHITDEISQSRLVGLLHDLGTVVNFRDHPRLRDTHVLNPHWVTNGIYKILNAKTLAEKQSGEVTSGELAALLDEETYPSSKHQFLFDLMERFELCYESYEQRGVYLVPELLPKQEPELNAFAAKDALRFEYHYNILPEGLLPRFIVRSRVLNQGMPRWRAGVLLTFEGNRAVVKADIQDRKISIAVLGDAAGRRRLLSVIRSDLERIHASIPRLQIQEKIPLPDYPGVVVLYADLLKLEAAGRTKVTVVVRDEIVDLDIATLLNGIEERKARRSETAIEPSDAASLRVRVAFSYSHEDEQLRDQLETQLKLLQRHEFIETWHDRKIIAGQEWQDVIDENFKRADLILLLISAEFIASDYCYMSEMTLAIERHHQGEAVVVPIILRQCNWKKEPFAKLQVLPKDFKPVTTWPDRDEAWMNIHDAIEKVVEEIRRKRR